MKYLFDILDYLYDIKMSLNYIKNNEINKKRNLEEIIINCIQMNDNAMRFLKEKKVDEAYKINIDSIRLAQERLSSVSPIIQMLKSTLIFIESIKS